MTAKKRWLNKIYPDSQDFPKNTQSDITWSSSDSDEEILAKKKKVESTNNKWITSRLKQNIINKKKVLPKIETDIHHSSSNSFQCVAVNAWNSNNSSPEVIRKLDLPRNKTKCKTEASSYRCCESPIISGLKLEELSPVLVQTSEDFNFNITKEASPVLGNKGHVLKNIRSKYNKAHVRQVGESSPELFETSTQIIDSESPEVKNSSPLFETDGLLSERIDPFPSQHSSQVICSNTDSGSSATDNIHLYHQPVPKKKCYKKGGLASLLQKTLHLQRTRVSIWQHEMYTKKADDIISFEEGEIINFTVKNKWKEYGSTLLECHLLPSNNLESPTNTEEIDLFIIIIGFSTNLNMIFDINGQYKLFPPYSVKTVNYKSRKVLSYFNVTKLLPFKAL